MWRRYPFQRAEQSKKEEKSEKAKAKQSTNLAANAAESPTENAQSFTAAQKKHQGKMPTDHCGFHTEAKQPSQAKPIQACRKTQKREIALIKQQNRKGSANKSNQSTVFAAKHLSEAKNRHTSKQNRSKISQKKEKSLLHVIKIAEIAKLCL